MTTKDTGKIRQRKPIKSSAPEPQEPAEEARPGAKYGPMPTFPRQRIWTRMVLILGTLVVVYFTSSSEKVIILAKQKDVVENRRQNIICSEDYSNEIKRYEGCFPLNCGRSVMDKLVSKSEVETLFKIGLRGFSHGVSDGGASILDLHSGALSKGKHFVNFYKMNLTNLFTANDFNIYKTVRTKIQHAIAHSFKISAQSLHLTHPTFFSRLTADPPVTTHDEYWHPHVDKDTYRSFHYTSLLYLNDYGVDFKGGRFIFIEPDNSSVVVEPRRGRVSMFTSGKENVHHVEKVTYGTRYALTVSFTCDSRSSISDPSVTKLQ